MLVEGSFYSETVDQARLSSLIDIEAARGRSRSFDKFSSRSPDARRTLSVDLKVSDCE